MYYQKSQDILDEIKKAKKIAVNLHRSPDPDSFSCAFSLYYFLCSLNKNVDVILTKKSDISSDLSSMEESKLVKFIDYKKINKKYDLLISPDSGSWQQVVDDLEIKIPNIPIIVIDHHESSEEFGKINLVEKSASSCSEIIFKLFKDWNFYIDKLTANLLLMGIVGDTGAFAFSDNPETLEISAELIKLGAKKTDIINKFFRTKKFKVLKYWGEYLTRMELDKEHKFVWTAIPFEIEKEYKIQSSGFSTFFGSMIEEADFSVVMSEDEKDTLKISLRARNNIDVSKLAEKLNGGGHKKAAGGILKGIPFKKGVEKVLEISKKYAEENR